MRTSTTHPLYVSWLPLEADQGRLGITLCPGKYQPVSSTGGWDRQLDLDLQALVDMGVHRLISLITEEDMVMLRVENLGEEAQRFGLAWNHLPLPDTTAPTDAWMERGIPVLQQLIDSIQGGEVVVVHCMGGLSRAGTFASMYLWLRGLDMEEAIQRVREERSPHAINPRQRAFLFQLANGE
jgi:ADP-ribosyl-[dinitrogen reductase] hydrolase